MTMIQKFKAAKNEEAADDWLTCWTGQDNDGNHFNVTTNGVHGSDLSLYTRGAEGDAELIARLLNWYYADQDAADEVLKKDPEAPDALALIKKAQQELRSSTGNWPEKCYFRADDLLTGAIQKMEGKPDMSEICLACDKPVQFPDPDEFSECPHCGAQGKIIEAPTICPACGHNRTAYAAFIAALMNQMDKLEAEAKKAGQA